MAPKKSVRPKSVFDKKAPRNPELIKGVRRFGRSEASKHRNQYKFSKKAPTPKKAAAPAPELTTPKFYRADDIKTPLKSRKSKQNITRLRASITPGTILIILAGKFRGKRVVFLRQLASGLLLVTGPFSANGVPLRRVNQAYVLSTATKIDVSSVDSSKITDTFFARPKSTKTKADFLSTEKPETKRVLTAEQKDVQSKIDTALSAIVKKTPSLSEYLGTRFSLTNGQKPHLLRF